MSRTIDNGCPIEWERFVSCLCIHRVMVQGCTFANYCAFAMCEGMLLWLLVKEPHFGVSQEDSW